VRPGCDTPDARGCRRSGRRRGGLQLRDALVERLPGRTIGNIKAVSELTERPFSDPRPPLPCHDWREERQKLAFRDYLRDYPHVAREYEELKRTVAARVAAIDPESRERYAAAKTDFIERIVAIAVARGYARRLSNRTDFRR
jgi:GrpB-like predicted nucleotidyltransferase (UPF0157 family)